MAAQGRWVFGYGSLMWRPGFAFVERQALFSMAGGAPSASIRFIIAARPSEGTGAGLGARGATRGAAFRVADADWPDGPCLSEATRAATETYVEAQVHVRLGDGRRVAGLGFLSDTGHPQWAGDSDSRPRPG